MFGLCTGTVRQRENIEADISKMILFQIFISKTETAELLHTFPLGAAL